MVEVYYFVYIICPVSMYCLSVIYTPFISDCPVTGVIWLANLIGLTHSCMLPRAAPPSLFQPLTTYGPQGIGHLTLVSPIYQVTNKH